MTATKPGDRKQTIKHLAERARQQAPTEKERHAQALLDGESDDTGEHLVLIEVVPVSLILEQINARNAEEQMALHQNAARFAEVTATADGEQPK